MRPSEGLISLWPLVVILVLVILSALSITPSTRLKTDLPDDFARLSVSGAGPDPSAAAQYWRVATSVIQWKYNRAAALPTQVPTDFLLATHVGKTLTPAEQAARAAFWTKLREEWPRPDNWHTTYSFDWHWAVRGFRDLSGDTLRFFHLN